MSVVRRQSLPKLTAGVLRDGLLTGRWVGTLPGEIKLAQELGVGRNTIHAALRLLEAEGLLDKKGLGRSRKVAGLGSGDKSRGPLRLLGICFLREAPERAIGTDRRAGKWGLIALCKIGR